MGFPTGVQIQAVENTGLLVVQSANGTSSTTVVPAGRMVAVTGFTIYSSVLSTFDIEDGNSVVWWAVQVPADETLAVSFDHPLLMDGLGIVLGGGVQQWSITYKDLGQPAQ